MKHVELFAGCGGMALGLEASGFDLIFANEISAMAGDTFAYNILNHDITGTGQSSDKVFWLDPRAPRSAFANSCPEDHTVLKAKPLQTNSHVSSVEISGSLIIGDIAELNELLAQRKLAGRIIKELGNGDIDLISGGPPCQSFSMAGLRELSNDRNQLPWEFVKSVELLRPKIAVLENVSGILKGFKNGNSEYYAWFEVAKAFAAKGYLPLCLQVNAKQVGVPQNRPRFLLFALRSDFATSLEDSCDKALKDALIESTKFLDLVRDKGPLIPFEKSLLRCYDSNRGDSLFLEDPFKHLATHNAREFISVSEAIGDLFGPQGKKASDYVERVNNSFGFRLVSAACPANTSAPKNSTVVKARFRFYQLLRDMKRDSPDAAKRLAGSLRGNDTNFGGFASEIDQLRSLGWMLSSDGTIFESASRKQVEQLLLSIKTKKRTQRALTALEPAPAALTIPDDVCHYDAGCLRTLSVRELARIQSFPDWFVFRSKTTTGGKLRRSQVPQYTQVGNAVPPLLGKSIGEVCKRLLQIATPD